MSDFERQYEFTRSLYNMELHDKFSIKAIYLAYHNADPSPLYSMPNQIISGYVPDAYSFYYFVLETSSIKTGYLTKSAIRGARLTFNLSAGDWSLKLVAIDPNDPEILNELERQQAVNLIEFIDLFGM